MDMLEEEKEVIRELARGKIAYLENARDIWNKYNVQSAGVDRSVMNYLFEVFSGDNLAKKELARVKLLGSATSKNTKPTIF